MLLAYLIKEGTGGRGGLSVTFNVSGLKSNIISLFVSAI